MLLGEDFTILTYITISVSVHCTCMSITHKSSPVTKFIKCLLYNFSQNNSIEMFILQAHLVLCASDVQFDFNSLCNHAYVSVSDNLCMKYII